ncbi:MAG: hypothetical protein KDK33_19255, partial [Leptospiraceae bacterium]|nr:hypothetical protein [Leptospiraceae bacterium]
MRFYWIVTLAAFAIIPLSVSGSQTLMAISIVWGGWLYFRGGRTSDSGVARAWHLQSPDSGHRSYALPFLMGALLFCWLLLVYGIRSLQFYWQGNSLFDPSPWHSEWTDLFLLLFAWLLVSLARQSHIESHRLSHYATMALLVFATLLVVAGFLSVFSEVRLSKLFTGYGHEFSARNRPQFPFATIGGLTLYRPIGFMNTRLSYAGLLNFGLLILAGRTLGALPRSLSRVLGGADGVDGSESALDSTSKWKRREWLVWSALIVIGLIILWMNGSRSGLLACGLSLGILCAFALYRGVKNRKAAHAIGYAPGASATTRGMASTRGYYG